MSAPPSRARAEEFGVEAVYFVVRADRAQLRKIAELVDDGTLRVTIAAAFPLAEGARGVRERGTMDRPPGKTILVVRDQPGG